MVLAEAEGRLGDTVAAATHQRRADEIFADLGRRTHHAPG
jgi:hypothetical protein